MKSDEKSNNNVNIEFKSKQKNKKEDDNSITELNYHKLQLENAIKDNEIHKLREELQQFKNLDFDTSSSFPWPDEFKNRWEAFVRTMIMDSFETINANYILLMKTINIKEPSWAKNMKDADFLAMAKKIISNKNKKK